MSSSFPSFPTSSFRFWAYLLFIPLRTYSFSGKQEWFVNDAKSTLVFLSPLSWFPSWRNEPEYSCYFSFSITLWQLLMYPWLFLLRNEFPVWLLFWRLFLCERCILIHLSCLKLGSQVPSLVFNSGDTSWKEIDRELCVRRRYRKGWQRNHCLGEETVTEKYIKRRSRFSREKKWKILHRIRREYFMSSRAEGRGRHEEREDDDEKSVRKQEVKGKEGREKWVVHDQVPERHWTSLSSLFFSPFLLHLIPSYREILTKESVKATKLISCERRVWRRQ